MSERRRIRVRLNALHALGISAFPIIFTIGFFARAITGDDSGVALSTDDRVTYAVLGLIPLPIAIHFMLFYYVEIAGDCFRVVRWFGLGSHDMPIRGRPIS
jgi:hypothetical protein